MDNAQDGGVTGIEPTQTRVFLVDDHPAVLLGVEALLAAHPGFVVCGTARRAGKARQAILTRQPDVAVVDLVLGAECGVALIRELRQRGYQRPLVAYSGSVDPALGERALAAGANGYLSKDKICELIAVLREVTGGGGPTPPAQRPAVNNPVLKPAPGSVALSTREAEVYRLLGEGLSVKEIAGRLGVHINTVYTYCDRLCEKLSLSDRRALNIAALRGTPPSGSASDRS